MCSLNSADYSLTSLNQTDQVGAPYNKMIKRVLWKTVKNVSHESSDRAAYIVILTVLSVFL